MNEELKKEELFLKGMEYYAQREYFESHEVWEELWSDYYLEDRKFVQALIQLSVSFVHLENNNMNGAKSLLRKAKEKFQLFSGIHRNINIDILLNEIELVENKYNVIDSPIDFDWTLIPNLE